MGLVSLIWIVNFLGFLTSGITFVYITDRVGFGIVSGDVPRGCCMC